MDYVLQILIRFLFINDAFFSLARLNSCKRCCIRIARRIYNTKAVSMIGASS
ncbi:hypothetical protein M413DRAFT_255282 [Hebeloma cylindrosporum]|uniref:Uncharacterized protein n=1 Tax=Hebeloma cylindrosporum TaxID=76867 RepID=A0A0C3C0G4_HEBCY|nr:hypothetical protein M413DRAFT_255282 [Hebeloma cylindrosporum h7]